MGGTRSCSAKTQELPEDGHGKALGQSIERLIQARDEGHASIPQQGIALIDQGTADRPKALGIQRFQGL